VGSQFPAGTGDNRAAQKQIVHQTQLEKNAHYEQKKTQKRPAALKHSGVFVVSLIQLWMMQNS